MNPRLLDKYTNELRPTLLTKLSLNNSMAIPKIEKIVLNMGIGKARENKNWLTSALEELGLISGQKAVKTISKKAKGDIQELPGGKVSRWGS